MAHNNTLSVAISRDEDAQHDLVLSFGTKGTIISGLSEADLLEIGSAIDCAIIKGEDDARARLIAAAPDLLAALESCEALICDLIDADELGDNQDLVALVRAAIAKAKGEYHGDH